LSVFFNIYSIFNSYLNFLEKDVIQPQVPLRLPCYDLTSVINLTIVHNLFRVGTSTYAKG